MAPTTDSHLTIAQTALHWAKLQLVAAAEEKRNSPLSISELRPLHEVVHRRWL